MFALLLGRGELSEEQRWRMADSLFAQGRPLIEGSLALLLLVAICWLQTGLPLFAGIGLATLALLPARLWLARSYWPARGTGSPQVWAARFLLGAIPTGALWGITSFAVMRLEAEPALRVGVSMVQAGWVAGVAIRNAASPASVMWQSLAATLPAALGFALSGDPLYQFSALFFLLQLSANNTIARFVGRQTVSLLRSEQALARANVELTGTCAALGEANEQLQHLSATDGLTGIGNRRAFDTMLTREWARAARERTALSLLVLDVDLFKLYNDHYGHPAGDQCLRAIAAMLESGLRRPPDFAGRFGGEEFVTLLPGIEAAGALIVAERLRRDVMATKREHAESPFGVVTVSIGAATAYPQPGTDPQPLIDAADQALYRAKQAGRNRIAGAPAAAPARNAA